MNVMNVHTVIILLDNYTWPIPVYSNNNDDSADNP